MSFKRIVAYNTVAQVGGKFFSMLISVFLTILLTRYLGVVGYGNYNLAITFVGFFLVLADFGLYPIALREMAQSPKESKKILGNAFIFRLFTSLLALLIAFLVGFLFPYPQIVKLAIGIVALNGLWSLLMNIITTVFQLNYRLDIPTFVEIFFKALGLFGVWLAIYFKFNLLGVFWIMALVSLGNALILFLFSRRFLKFLPQFNLIFLFPFLKEVLPMGVVAILSSIHFKIDTIILSLLKSSYEVGIYGVAYRVFENLIFIPAVFTGLLFPKFSQLCQDPASLRAIFQKTINVLILAIFPIFFSFFFLAPQIAQVLGGRDFIFASSPFRILLLALIPIFFICPFQQILIATGKQKLLIWVIGGATVLNLLSNILLIKYFSYNGAAVATFISELALVLSMGFLSAKVINIFPNFQLIKQIVLPIIIASIVAGFVIFFIPYIAFSSFSKLTFALQVVVTGTALIISLGIFGGTLMLFKVIPRSLMQEIISRKSK